jgi:DNA-binding MarR family transcriptional regulator
MNEFSHCPTEGAIGLLALLIKSGRLAESRLDDALAAAQLTFVKWRALDTLAKGEEAVPLKLLPGQLHCVKSNVTQLVDKLEAEGLLRRLPDPEDRRGTRVDLTEAGRAAHKAGREALEQTTRAVFETFQEEDRETLRRLLHLLEAPPSSRA